MKKETREIKSKGEVLGKYEYSYPENLSEALDVDGEDKVYKLYAQQRRIRSDDAERAKKTGGGGLPKALIAAIKGANPDLLKKIAAEMGLEVA